MAYSPVQLQKLPTTRRLKPSIFFLFLYCSVLAGIGTWFIVDGGRSWDADTQTLTSVLATLGVVFTIAGKAVSSLSRSARMQYLVDKAIKRSVSLQRFHEMDLISRGVRPYLTGFWNIVYRCIFPLIGLLMTAVLKKALSTGFEPSVSAVQDTDLLLIDLIDTTAGIRGTGVPGAIFFNSTLPHRVLTTLGLEASITLCHGCQHWSLRDLLATTITPPGLYLHCQAP